MTFAVLLPVFPSHRRVTATQDRHGNKARQGRWSGWSPRSPPPLASLTPNNLNTLPDLQCQTTCAAKAKIIGLGF